MNSTETLSLLGLLGYRQNVTIGGSFFGNYNADVRTVPLSADGKCDRTIPGLGTSSTDNTGAFSVNYPRISQSGGFVCVIASPKLDGTSRFFAVDQQKEFPWTGSSAFSILVLPEPSTTSRSQFNVVSTMFNRMATQRLERLSKGNTDLSKTASYLRSANKQIVSQFGLSKGISRGVLRASSLENATPDLNDIAIDFNNKEDPTTLKFTVMIGGIQSLGDPSKPESYDQVVNVISKYLASGTGSSVDESGEPLILPGQTQPLSLGGGNSLASQISQKVAVFVQAQSAALGLPASAVAAVTQQVQAQVAAVDKPSFGVIAPPVVVEVAPKLTYTLEGTPYYAGQLISIKPDYTNSNAEKYSIVSATPSLPSFIKLNSFTGEISGLVPTSLSSIINLKLNISGTAPGGKSITREINLQLIPALVMYANNSPIGSAGQSFSLAPLSESTTATQFSISSSPSLPEYISFNTSTGVISGTIPDSLLSSSTYNVTIVGTVPSGVSVSRTISLLLSPQAKISYLTNTLNYNAGQIFSISPDTSNTTTTSFSLSNNPSFMSINPTTGVISGTVPTSLVGSVPYSVVVTGTVADGSQKSQTLNFTFSGSYFTFPQASYSYVTNQPISIIPTSYQISNFRFTQVCYNSQCQILTSESSATSPIQIDPNSGEITGSVPPDFIGSANFSITITGSANSGDISNVINISMTGKPGIVYPNQDSSSPGSLVYLGAESVTLVPVIVGQYTSLSVQNLPPGMNYDESGVISGSSASISAIYNSIVTISNQNGSSNYTIQFKPIAPSGFSYPLISTALRVGQPFSLSPATYNGGVKSCALSSACIGESYIANLPEGLNLNSDCSITGTPLSVSLSGNYCISAFNISGSTLASINFVVTSTTDLPAYSISSSSVVFPPLNLSLTSQIGSNTYFTTDGSNPTTSSNQYTTPIPVWSLAGKMIKAFSTKLGYDDSPVASINGIIGVAPLKTGSVDTSLTGDDGFYKNGLTRTYKTNADGTITFDATGLTWDNSKNSDGSATWINASSICTTKGLGWRLPTVEELSTLINVNYISGVNVDADIQIKASPYWTSTESKEAVGSNNDSLYAYSIGFGTGRIFADLKSSSIDIKCVKSQIRFNKTNAYKNLTSNSIIDQATGLVWEKSYRYATWSEAMANCNTLSIDGMKWRLPNRNELISLVDYSKTQAPLIDSSFFVDSPNKFWSSTRAKYFGSSASEKFLVNFSIYDDNQSIFGGYGVTSGANDKYNYRCVSGSYSNTEVIYPLSEYSLTQDLITGTKTQISISPIISSSRNFIFTSSNLPTGFSLGASSGVITGTQDNGSKSFTILASSTESDVTQRVNYSYSFTITMNESNPNLVAYFPLDGTIADRSNLASPLSSSITGSGVVPAVDRKGKINGAYSFNGNGYIVVPNNPRIQMTNNFTISTWVKANQYKILMGIVSKYISSGTDGYILRFAGSQLDNSELRSSTSYNTNTWYHVVGTVTSTGLKKIYVDGVLIATGTPGIVIKNNNDPIHIGNDYSDGIRMMNGFIDEVRIYNKELSSTEVQNLYNLEKP